MVRDRLILAVLVGLATSQPANAGKNSQPFQVEVPGGIDGAKRAKLWCATKTKCLEMGYSVENEDQELGSILCSLPSPMGSYTLLMTFDRTSFAVTSKGTATRVPLMGGIMNSAKKRRKEILAHLSAVAVQPATSYASNATRGARLARSAANDWPERALQN
jgi:hypothetical protein